MVVWTVLALDDHEVVVQEVIVQDSVVAESQGKVYVDVLLESPLIVQVRVRLIMFALVVDVDRTYTLVVVTFHVGLVAVVVERPTVVAEVVR
jgi:hypothetical protein